MTLPTTRKLDRARPEQLAAVAAAKTPAEACSALLAIDGQLSSRQLEALLGADGLGLPAGKTACAGYRREWAANRATRPASASSDAGTGSGGPPDPISSLRGQLERAATSGDVRAVASITTALKNLLALGGLGLPDADEADTGPDLEALSAAEFRCYEALCRRACGEALPDWAQWWLDLIAAAPEPDGQVHPAHVPLPPGPSAPIELAVPAKAAPVPTATGPAAERLPEPPTELALLA